MSRKHFNKIAQIVSEIRDRDERYSLALKFADMLRETNPNFNRVRFLDACEAN